MNSTLAVIILELPATVQLRCLLVGGVCVKASLSCCVVCGTCSLSSSLGMALLQRSSKDGGFAAQRWAELIFDIYKLGGAKEEETLSCC